MNRVFPIKDFFRVRDETLVSPFLNSQDSKSGLPFNLLGAFSLAGGIIESQRESKIHIFPFVTQVTFVRSGRLRVKMKSPEDATPYSLLINPGAAIISKGGTLFQLISEREACEVLYIVSPPYVYVEGVYDDSVVLDENWSELQLSNWQLSKPLPTAYDRQKAIERLAATTSDRTGL